MRKKSVTEKIFDEILTFLDGALERPDFSVVKGGISRRQRRIRDDELHKRRRAMRSLRSQGLISFTGRGSMISVKLTKQGSHYAMVRAAVLTKTVLPTGSWCYVIFDIPEDRRNARRALSNFLSDTGFVRVQKSVWRTRRDVADVMTKFVNFHRAKKYIHVVVGSEI